MSDYYATQQPRLRSPDVAVSKLNVFTGKWVGEAIMPGLTVATEQYYEWLPGSFFISHRGRMDYGQRLESARIIGYETSIKQYVMYTFDSMGNARIYKGSLQDGIWRFTGEFERVQVVFGPDGNTMTSTWEREEDGWSWTPLCEIRETKVHM